ncbi:MAG TPA: carboxypeptidase-like regulatory domain-containing protein, partial [Puia sp.]|nr:carboxypeptidase-like regulatory domain-containing protein [Puia sp.]
MVMLVLLGLVLLGGGSCQLKAQATWSTISGYVNDPSGAVIPGANVTVTEERTGVATKGVTDSTGLYTITHLSPGTYTVTVQAPGFKRFVQEHV